MEESQEGMPCFPLTGISWGATGDHVTLCDPSGFLGVVGVEGLARMGEDSSPTIPVKLHWPFSEEAMAAASDFYEANGEGGILSHEAPLLSQPEGSPFLSSAGSGVEDIRGGGSNKKNGGKTGREEAGNVKEVEGSGDNLDLGDEEADAGAPSILSLTDTAKQFGMSGLLDENAANSSRSVSDPANYHKSHAPVTEGGMDLEAQAELVERYVSERYGLILPQAPFQSTCTPFIRNSRRRYLCWNAVGTIVAFKEGSGARYLEMRYTDTSYGSLRRENDPEVGFSLGVLSKEGALLAAPYRPPGQDSAARPATIRFIALGGFGSSTLSSWSMELPVWDRSRTGDIPVREYSVCQGSGVGGGEGEEDWGGVGVELEEGEEEEAAEIEEEEEEAEGGSSEDMARLHETKEGNRRKQQRKIAPSRVSRVKSIPDYSSVAESPLAIALGDGWGVVATDRDYVRCFRTGGGLQDAVLAMPGPIITIAAHGSLFAVFYHANLPSNSRQSITTELYLYTGLAGDLGAFPTLLATAGLPVGKDSHMNWAGFSPSGMLHVHTTAGSLLGMAAATGWRWTPVGDTRLAAACDAGRKNLKSVDGVPDSYWPVYLDCPPERPGSVSAGGVGSGGGGFGLGKGAGGGGSSPSTPHLPGRDLALFSVFCRGGGAGLPTASNPPPLTKAVPLQMPLLFPTPQGSSISYPFSDSSGEGGILPFTCDYTLLLREMGRLQRSWGREQGLIGGNCARVVAAGSAASAASKGLDAPNSIRQLADMLEGSRKADSKECADLDKRIVRQLEKAFEEKKDVAAVHLASRLHKDKSFEIASVRAFNHNCTGAGERIAQLGAVRDIPLPKQESLFKAAIAAAEAAAQTVASEASNSAASKAVESALSKQRALLSGEGADSSFGSTTTSNIAVAVTKVNAPVSFTDLKSSIAPGSTKNHPMPFSKKRNANEGPTSSGLAALLKSPERGYGLNSMAGEGGGSKRQAR